VFFELRLSCMFIFPNLHFIYYLSWFILFSIYTPYVISCMTFSILPFHFPKFHLSNLVPFGSIGFSWLVPL
jgi:hypothetical protein